MQRKKMEFETKRIKLPHVKAVHCTSGYLYFMGGSDVLSSASGIEYSFRGLWLFVLGVMLFPLGIIGALVSAARKAEGKSAESWKAGKRYFAAVGVIGILFLILLFYGSKCSMHRHMQISRPSKTVILTAISIQHLLYQRLR